MLAFCLVRVVLLVLIFFLFSVSQHCRSRHVRGDQALLQAQQKSHADIAPAPSFTCLALRFTCLSRKGYYYESC